MFIDMAYAAAGNSVGSEEVGIMSTVGYLLFRWFGAIMLFFLSFFVAKIASKLIVNRMRKMYGEGEREEFLLLVDRSIYLCVVVFLMIISLKIVDIDLTWVLGAMSFGIGFAFKDILSNLFGGMVILSQKRIKIGDFVKVGDTLGKITAIEARTTEIKGLDGTAMIVPNADMVTDVVQNFTANDFRRISLEVGVHYATPLDEAISTTLNATKKHEKVVASPEVEVICKEFGDSAILLEVRFWVESFDNWWKIRSEIVQRIKTDFDAHNIIIPFPIRTLALDEKDMNVQALVKEIKK